MILLNPWIMYTNLKQTMTSIGDHVEKLESSYIASKMVQLLWKTVWQFLKKLSIELIIPQDTTSNFTPRYVLKSTENIHPHKSLYMSAYCSTIHNYPKVQTTQKSRKWWMNSQIWYIHVLQYYSTIKRNERLIHLMNLENIALKWEKPAQKTHIV